MYFLNPLLWTKLIAILNDAHALFACVHIYNPNIPFFESKLSCLCAHGRLCMWVVILLILVSLWSNCYCFGVWFIVSNQDGFAKIIIIDIYPVFTGTAPYWPGAYRYGIPIGTHFSKSSVTGTIRYAPVRYGIIPMKPLAKKTKEDTIEKVHWTLLWYDLIWTRSLTQVVTTYQDQAGKKWHVKRIIFWRPLI